MSNVITLARWTTRNEVMKLMKAALKKRSGKEWSVTGGKGTAYGWITISAPPKRCTWHYTGTGRRENGQEIYDEVNDPSKPYGHMGPEDRKELGELLDLGKEVHCQGESVAASSGHKNEYLARCEGRTPEVYGERYWD